MYIERICLIFFSIVFFPFLIMQVSELDIKANLVVMNLHWLLNTNLATGKIFYLCLYKDYNNALYMKMFAMRRPLHWKQSGVEIVFNVDDNNDYVTSRFWFKKKKKSYSVSQELQVLRTWFTYKNVCNQEIFALEKIWYENLICADNKRLSNICKLQTMIYFSISGNT